MGVKHPFILLCILFVSACGPVVPATTPAQLAHTPGPAVILTTDRYQSDAFSATYPRGWGVVTSAAFSTPWVVFTTPDETAVFVLAFDLDDTQITPPIVEAAVTLQREERTITIGEGEILHAVMVAPSAITPDVALPDESREVLRVLFNERWQALLVQFERLVASVE